MKKEEILEEYSEPIKINGEWEFNLVPKEKALEAMGEYAKHECIELLKHLSLKEYDFSSYAPSLDDKEAIEFYEEYLNDKNK